MGEGEHSIIFWLYDSLLVGLSSGCDLHKCFFRDIFFHPTPHFHPRFHLSKSIFLKPWYLLIIFSFFFPNRKVGWRRLLKEYPFPEIVVNLWQSSLHLENESLLWRRFWHILQWLLFIFSWRATKKKIFIRSSPWEPDGVKATIVLWPPGVSLFYTSPLINTASSNSSKLTFKYYTSLWIQQLLLQANRSRLCISGCTCLSRFQSGGFSCNLSFLMGPWKAVNFQFI